MGLPWYRPTRVLHVVPGARVWLPRRKSRSGPSITPTRCPPWSNIGLGCPTGVKFGTKSNFPEKYRRAFFIMDWTFGRILAVHLHPEGASYTAQNPLKSYTHPTGPEASEDVEVFLSGKGMPLTDLEFGKDGAMYFTVGGRGTQAGLYRVSWIGNETPSRRRLAEDPSRAGTTAIAARESVAADEGSRELALRGG